MGKQTRKSGSHFGGEWTKEKLTIIQKYLSFYVNALKNTKCKKIYIDAFAGSGKTLLKDGKEVDGSAIISLSLDFDHYYFIELDTERLNNLSNLIDERYPEKKSKVTIINGDCNDKLVTLLQSLTKYQRGVMFLDPYAMELDWSILEEANKTGVLDIWYLFPINAVSRQMPITGKVTDKMIEKLNLIFGTDKWLENLYYEDPQISIFEDKKMKRHNFEKLVEFVLLQLNDLFAYVSPKSKLLKNSNNAPMFLLCFAMTNNSPKAIGLGSKVVNDIFKSLEQ